MIHSLSQYQLCAPLRPTLPTCDLLRAVGICLPDFELFLQPVSAVPLSCNQHQVCLLSSRECQLFPSPLQPVSAVLLSPAGSASLARLPVGIQCHLCQSDLCRSPYFILCWLKATVSAGRRSSALRPPSPGCIPHAAGGFLLVSGTVDDHDIELWRASHIGDEFP